MVKFQRMSDAEKQIMEFICAKPVISGKEARAPYSTEGSRYSSKEL